MFQILTFTEARLSSITNRIEKHGDDDARAISLGFEIEAANTLLNAIDPKLRHALYVAVEGQEQLPGIEPSTPVLRANAIDRVNLVTKHEGWTLEMDDGIDDTQPLVFGGVKVDKLSVEPKQGGSIVLRLRVGTSDISADKLGKIGMHLAQSVWIIIRQPTAPADVIDGTVDAFKADHPDADLFAEPDPVARDATDIFAQQHAQDGDAGPGAGDPDDADPEWPESEAAPQAPASRRGVAVKYRNGETGETWTGRGLQPKWLKQALEFGASLADFEVGAAAGAVE